MDADGLAVFEDKDVRHEVLVNARSINLPCKSGSSMIHSASGIRNRGDILVMMSNMG
jgi:hypothetical protein